MTVRHALADMRKRPSPTTKPNAGLRIVERRQKSPAASAPEAVQKTAMLRAVIAGQYA